MFPLIAPEVRDYDAPMCGVYAITNSANGRTYIGSSVHVTARWRDHVWSMARGIHENPLLLNAWQKHGSAAFTCRLREFCLPSDLLAREQAHIDDNRGGYNLCAVAGKPPVGGRRGARLSHETKAKLRAANIGKRLSNETRRRMSESRTGLKRGPMSADARAARSAASRGVKRGPRPPEVGLRISAAKRGKRMSPEAVETNRRAHIGRRLTQQTKERVRAALLAHHAAKRLALAANLPLFDGGTA